MPLFMIERNYAQVLNPPTASSGDRQVERRSRREDGCIRFSPRTSARLIACMRRIARR